MRIRLRLPEGRHAEYRYQDLVHDALVSGMIAAGAKPERVIGKAASPWTFACIGRAGGRGRPSICRELVVSTPDPVLGEALSRLDPVSVRYARALTGEVFDFSGAEVVEEPDPVVGSGVSGFLLLSPIVLRGENGRWLDSLAAGGISRQVNRRLSALAGREVDLRVEPDSLYIRANPKHSALVPLRSGGGGGRTVFVIGLVAPLVLSGSEEDLRLAWFAGIGSKTRNGFGCLGLLDRCGGMA